MRFIPSIHAALLLAAVLLAGPPDPARAVDFRPVLYVNNGAITGYELDQRIRFLQILGTDGDLRQMAIDALIDDRLRLQAGERFGFDVGDRQIAAGMAEFAGRANLETEQFIAAIGEAGVAPETFRDFVRAGLVWREMVRARFSGQVAIPDAGAERAQAIEAGRGLPPRVLLSELVLPREPGETPEELVERASALAARARGETAFAAAAQRLSAADTAAEGGRLDWRPLTDLPGPVRGAVAGLQPGQVSAPVVSGDRAAIYLLRAARAAAEVAPEGVHVEYGEFRLAAAEDAARIAARADRCGDLYAEVEAEGQLTFGTRPEARLPADLRAALAGLDAGETAVIARGGAPVMVMLCARRAGGPSDVPGIEAMRGLLVNERLAAEAELWLAELRATAILREP